MGERTVRFSKLTPRGETDVRVLRQSDLLKCPHCILVADHYRDDGTCRCDDAAERKRMMKEWGYAPADFKGIPLRRE